MRLATIYQNNSVANIPVDLRTTAENVSWRTDPFDLEPFLQITFCLPGFVGLTALERPRRSGRRHKVNSLKLLVSKNTDYSSLALKYSNSVLNTSVLIDSWQFLSPDLSYTLENILKGDEGSTFDFMTNNFPRQGVGLETGFK